MERTIQFEDFLNRIHDDVNVDKSIFLDLFHILYKGGKPNRNHLLIARLLKEGYIKRTPRGREATPAAYNHMGKIKNNQNLLL